MEKLRNRSDLKVVLGVLLLAIVFVSCDDSYKATRSYSNVGEVQRRLDSTGTYFEEELIVSLKPRVGIDAFLADLNQAGNRFSVIERDPFDPSKFLIRAVSSNLDKTRQTIEAHASVEGVSFNRPVGLRELPEAPVPRDPLFDQLWGLNNTGQEAASGTVGKRGADIGILKAWAMTKGSRDVVVAVIDTGVDYRHKDLSTLRLENGALTVVDDSSNIWKNPNEIIGDGLDNDGNGLVDDVYGWNFVTNSSDPRDDHGHGTHCSGTIAALEGNLYGVVGVAPNVKVMGVKFLDSQGGGNLFAAVKAIEYVIDTAKRFPNKRFIMSNSWGMDGKIAELDKNNFLLHAVKKAEEAKIPFVVAAGNSSVSIDDHYDTPASFPFDNVIAVAATNNNDHLAYFSSYGLKSVHVAAPGVNILSTVPEELYGKPFAVFSGTSMATPHVAGVVALLLSQNIGLEPKEIRQILMDTVDQVDDLYGRVASGGRVNVARALMRDKNPGKALQMVAVPYSVQSIRDYRDSFDKMIKITQEGAETMRVHFEKIEIEDSDYIQILDKRFRVIIEYTGISYDVWTPPMIGDAVYIRHWISSGSGSVSINQGYRVDQYEYAKKAG